jgi:hypothetical protein
MARNSHATIGQLLDTVPSLWSIWRLHDRTSGTNLSVVNQELEVVIPVSVSHEHGSTGFKYSICSESRVGN